MQSDEFFIHENRYLVFSIVSGFGRSQTTDSRITSYRIEWGCVWLLGWKIVNLCWNFLSFVPKRMYICIVYLGHIHTNVVRDVTQAWLYEYSSSCDGKCLFSWHWPKRPYLTPNAVPRVINWISNKTHLLQLKFPWLIPLLFGNEVGK